MSNHGKGGNKGAGASNSEGKIPHLPSEVTVQVSKPLTIRQESTADDNERYSEERNHRESTLTVAQYLNWITVVGVMVALISLLAVGETYNRSRKSLELDQRAWLNISEVSILVPITTTKKGFWLVKLLNSGKTPALNEHLTCIGVLINGVPPCSPYKSATYFATISPGPQGTGTTIYVDPQQQYFVDSMSNPNYKTYLVFEIEYADIFGNVHQTTYCGISPPDNSYLPHNYLSTCENGGKMN